MRWLLILMVLFAVSASADEYLFTYGGTCEGTEAGYLLDTFFLTHWYDGTIDTLIRPLYDTTTAVCSILTLTGVGLHVLMPHYFFNGFTEWYSDNITYLNATTSISGVGDDRVTLYAVDTSGTDVAVSGVMLSFKDLSDNPIGHTKTKSGGYNYFDWTATDTVKVTGTKPGYVMTGMSGADTAGTMDSIYITGTQTDTIYGYNIAIGAPSGDSLCRVYGYTYSPEDGIAIEDAVITWSLKGRNIYDVCNGTIIVKNNGSTPSDANGLWTLDLLYSQCLQRSSTASTSDSILYEIVISYPGGSMVQNKSFNVPSADSVAFTW